MAKNTTARAPKAPKQADTGRRQGAADRRADSDAQTEFDKDTAAEAVAPALTAEQQASDKPVTETTETAPATFAEAVGATETIGEDTAAEVSEAAPEAAPAAPAEQAAAPAPKPVKAPTPRGLSVSATWARPEVRAARSTHHGVTVAGKGQFKSVPEAFRALGLPMGKMIPFRLLVKETGAATFEKTDKQGNKETFEFTRVG